MQGLSKFLRASPSSPEPPSGRLSAPPERALLPVKVDRLTASTPPKLSMPPPSLRPELDVKVDPVTVSMPVL